MIKKFLNKFVVCCDICGKQITSIGGGRVFHGDVFGVKCNLLSKDDTQGNGGFIGPNFPKNEELFLSDEVKETALCIQCVKTSLYINDSYGEAEFGKEAEELRAGLEEILGNISYYKKSEIEDKILKLLDNVDARDSLKYLENKPIQKKEAVTGYYDKYAKDQTYVMALARSKKINDKIFGKEVKDNINDAILAKEAKCGIIKDLQNHYGFEDDDMGCGDEWDYEKYPNENGEYAPYKFEKDIYNTFNCPEGLKSKIKV